MKAQPGDMYMVTECVNGRITIMELMASDPSVEIVRIERDDGAVQYLSREEYEGRKNGTWETFKG
jgi:hypothetical protein